VWNSNFIDHVQVTFAEKKGIGKRGKFFDGVGMLRDVGQNHLMQLVATVIMEQPRSFSREDVRDARVKAIQAIQCIEPNEVSENVVIGQYAGYLQEEDVQEGSATETFVAMRFFVGTPRFSGVPFFVRAGKMLREDRVEISLIFKQTCHILFKEFGCPEIGNILTIRIQPDEGIKMRFIAKKPGARVSLEGVEMKFSYKEEFGWSGVDAYEKVLLDIFTGDQMLFNRSDELESSWEFITKVLQGWSKSGSKPVVYDQGSWGPNEADMLIERNGRKWL
jgi:glucose-6-phosphate 1-dehydrogenase